MLAKKSKISSAVTPLHGVLHLQTQHNVDAIGEEHQQRQKIQHNVDAVGEEHQQRQKKMYD